MIRGFWEKLDKPFFCLAPMADVTDPPFRSIIAENGKPDVMYTQFVSCDGLCSAGKDVLTRDLEYGKKERPIVAQFFGKNPDNFYKCAILAKKLKFDGIDINMGCPDKNVMKQGGGAALINNPKLAAKIIKATKEGACNIPVSIKTRVGDTNNEIPTWVPKLLKETPAALIMHARTRKDMSKVPANWSYIKQAVEIAKGSKTLIVGNGDVLSVEDGEKKCKKSGADGAMIGRAVFGNPWIFNKKKNIKDISTKERLEVLVEHTERFEKMIGDIKNFSVMKKHYKAYVNGFGGAKELRIKLMKTKNSQEVEKIIKKSLSHYL